MGRAGVAASSGTHALLVEVDRANREKLIAVAALDPACRLPTPVIADPARRTGGICVPGGPGAPSPGDRPLKRFDSRSFGPALITLEVLATYLGAVDAIISRKQVDVGAELEDAVAKLQAVSTGLSASLGLGLTPTISDAQRQAVSGALSLISTLADEARTVDELRRFETPARKQEFDSVVSRLRVINDGLTTILDEELQQQELVLELIRPTASDSRQQRHDEMGLIERREQVAQLRPALRKAVDELATANDDYLALLRDGRGPLSKEERAKRARVTQQRVLAALSAVTNVIGAF